MSLSHACANTSISSIKETFEQLALATQSICQRALKDEFAKLEIELHQKFAEAERKCMQRLLEQYDWNYPSFISDETVFKKASRDKKIYMTLAGEVKVERTLFRTARNGPTYCPMELNTGLIEGFWTPQAAKQAIHLVSLNTPAEAEKIFKEFGLMAPSKSSLDRLPKQLSQLWEGNRLTLEQQLFDVSEIPGRGSINVRHIARWCHDFNSLCASATRRFKME